MAKQQMTGQRDQGMMEQVRIADVKEYGVYRYFAAPVLTVQDVAGVPPTDQYVAVHCERSGQGRLGMRAADVSSQRNSSCDVIARTLSLGDRQVKW